MVSAIPPTGQYAIWRITGEETKMSLGSAFHILAAVIWVGGMFFAHMVLRPSAGLLDSPTRLALWERVKHDQHS